MSLSADDAPRIIYGQNSLVTNGRPQDIYVLPNRKFAFFGDGTLANVVDMYGTVMEQDWRIPAKIMRLYENPVQAATNTYKQSSHQNIRFDFDLHSPAFQEFFACIPNDILTCLKVDETHDVVHTLRSGVATDKIIMSVWFETVNAVNIATISFYVCDDGQRDLLFWFYRKEEKITQADIALEIKARFLSVIRYTVVSGQLSNSTLHSILSERNLLNAGAFDRLLIDNKTHHVIFNGLFNNTYGINPTQIKTYYGEHPVLNPRTHTLVARPHLHDVSHWCKNYDTIVEMCMVLFSLPHNSESMLMIINWLPFMWLFRRALKIGAIERTLASVRRVLERRRTSNKRSL